MVLIFAGPMANPRRKSSFKEMGFLASTVADSIESFHKTYHDWIKLYYDLNCFAQLQRVSTSMQKNNLRSGVVYCLFYRLLSTYQSAFLLIEHGSDIDAKALLRNLVETVFALVATVKDDAFLQPFIAVDEKKRIALLRSVVEIYNELKEKQTDQLLTEEQVASMQDDINDYEQRQTDCSSSVYFTKEMRETVKVSEIAKRADLTVVYKQHYSYLCLYAHPSPNGMRDYFTQDALGKVYFKSGQIDNGAEANMRMAISVLILGLDAFSTFFERDLKGSFALFSQRLNEVIEHSHTQKAKA